MTTEPLIQAFLAERRWAFVGLSRNPADFSRVLFRELLVRGYDALPVTPHLLSAEDRPCVARVQDVAPPVRVALLLTPPAVTERVVRDCAEAGVKTVWMHRGAGAGASSRDAVFFCRAHGIDVVDGVCPYMYLPSAGFVHRAHGLVHRLFTRRAA